VPLVHLAGRAWRFVFRSFRGVSTRGSLARRLGVLLGVAIAISVVAGAVGARASRSDFGPPQPPRFTATPTIDNLMPGASASVVAPYEGGFPTTVSCQWQDGGGTV
jgi:hypothetical protein